MSEQASAGERIRRRRLDRGWTQGRLAQAAGISRAAVSAVESDRLSPSVNAAIALAVALGSTVENLFGSQAAPPSEEWAWGLPVAAGSAPPHWRAEVGGRRLLYPVETTATGRLPHDEPAGASSGDPLTSRTLVIATCDPAAGILVDRLARDSGVRAIALMRSSGDALELLRQGLIHVAGIHFAEADRRGGHERLVRERLGSDRLLLNAAVWEVGIASAATAKVRRTADAVNSRLRWVGREPGSAAAERIQEIFEGRPLPRRFVRSHRGVADAIRDGFADVGVTLRLAGEERNLDFLRLRRERYDLCFPADQQDDPRLAALIDAVRSAAYRRAVGALPGYDVRHAGECVAV